jgi:hypothetical protein
MLGGDVLAQQNGVGPSAAPQNRRPGTLRDSVRQRVADMRQRRQPDRRRDQDGQRPEDNRNGRDGRGDWNNRNNDWWDRDDRDDWDDRDRGDRDGDNDRGDWNNRDNDWNDRWDRDNGDWNDREGRWDRWGRNGRGRWWFNPGWWYGYPGGWYGYPRQWRRFPGPPPQAPLPSRGSLGVYLRDLPGGLLITSVTPRGPADEAGLRSGDLILAIDGRRLETTREAQRFLFRKDPGERVRVLYDRNGRVRRTAARLEPFRAVH